MVAVDAGEVSLIRASLGRLPTFRRLFAEGAFFPLRSTVEHISASVWPSMYTGTPPRGRCIRPRSFPGECPEEQHTQILPGSLN
jgi:predicted AlkP superfamily phosphohydrolase/phosphomutase